MTDFVRARSDEKKEIRMNEIKKAVDELFTTHTYHEITLSKISEKLSWSRANLYKYVISKEEIFLELLLDKQKEYYLAIKSAFPIESKYSKEVFAEVWAGIITSHKSYFKYSSILTTIIETNVTLERLVEFKKNVFADINDVTLLFSEYLQLQGNTIASLAFTIHSHAIGLCNNCSTFPLIKEATKLAGIPQIKIDFKHEMKEFTLMCLNHYCS